MTPRCAALAGALVLAISLGSAAPAHADGAALLDDAQRALGDIDYEGARALVTRALEEGGLDLATLIRAERMAGEIAAAIGDAEGARSHFVRLIMLEPGAALAEGESPKIAEPFAAARAEAARLGALTIEVQAERSPAKVRLVVEVHDPLGLVTGFRVRLPSGALIEHQGLDVELPADDDTPLALTVIMIDAHGNELASREVSSEARARPLPGVTTRDRRFPTLVRWPTWTALAVISGGVGGYFAWRVRGDEDDLAAINLAPELHTFDEAQAVADAGDRHALYANIGIGVAGAAAVAAILTFVLEPGPVEVLPAPGGATAAVRF